MTTSDRKKALPPYVPYRTFTTYLDSVRTFVPQPVDRSSMRSFSGAIQGWLLNSLRYLNMIDDNGNPKPRLHQLAAASQEERKPMLRQLIQAEYPFLQGVDLQRVSPRALDMAFEGAGAKGDTVRKCVAFFLAMAKDADMPMSSLLAKTKRRASSSRTNGSRRPIAAPPPVTPVQPLPLTTTTTTKTSAEQLLDILDPETMTDDEQAAVWTLLKFLKKNSRVGG